MLSIWDQEDICPSGYEPCTYGCWKWGKDDSSTSIDWGMEPLEVIISEDIEGDYPQIEVKLPNGEIIAFADENGGEEYYPVGSAGLGFECWKNQAESVSWLLAGLGDFEEESDPEASAWFRFALKEGLEFSDLKQVILREGESLPRENWAAIILSDSEVDVSEIENSLKKGRSLVEVRFSNRLNEVNRSL